MSRVKSAASLKRPGIPITKRDAKMFWPVVMTKEAQFSIMAKAAEKQTRGGGNISGEGPGI